MSWIWEIKIFLNKNIEDTEYMPDTLNSLFVNKWRHIIYTYVLHW